MSTDDDTPQPAYATRPGGAYPPGELPVDTARTIGDAKLGEPHTTMADANPDLYGPGAGETDDADTDEDSDQAPGENSTTTFGY